MNKPDKLYKYRSLSGEALGYTKNLILNGEVYFQDISKFNDPFEGRFSILGSDEKAMGFANINGDFGVYCMSSKCDDILMWAHYADSYSGVCVEFDLTIGNSILSNAEKVDYVDLFKDIKYGDNLRTAILVKAKCWGYEDEWRVIYQKGVHVLNKGVISGVILGSKILPKNAHCIGNWLDVHNNIPGNRKIRAYCLTADTDKYKLVVK